MLELMLGASLAVAGLAFVLAPLVQGAASGAGPESPDAPIPESSALDALREIEFDRATGKLSDEDYAGLKATYTPRAREEMRALEEIRALDETREEEGTRRGDVMRAEDRPVLRDGVDAAELLIQRVKATRRQCPTCGPRPEGDALYCSNCGRTL
jgi:hypothetical protein